MRRPLPLLCLAGVLLVACPAAARVRVDCTAQEQAAAQQALAAFQRGMPKQRAAYFKTHRKAAQRRAFVKKQAARLAALRAAAACQVIPPPPPPDTTPPKLAEARVDSTTVTLTFDEALTGDAPATAFSATVAGLAWRVTAALVSSKVVTLTLGLGADAGQAVQVTYAGTSLRDDAGNAVAAFTAQPTNVSPGAPSPGPGSFSPSLAKPSFADNHADPNPWVGEWGPKTDPYWLQSTGTLRYLIVPVDFPDAVATRPPSFYKSVFESRAPAWYREVSYDRLNLQLTTLDKWVRMSRPAADYGLAHCCPRQQTDDFMAELVAKLDAEIDFSQVDAIWAVGPESSGPNLDILLYRRWPGEGITADGKELRWGVVGNGNFRSEDTAYYQSWYLVHDTGHLLGLSDLYGRTCPTCTDTHEWVGVWSMMDTAQPVAAGFLAWDRWLLRWLDPAQIRGVTEHGQVLDEVIAPLETVGGVKMIVVPLDPSHLYAVEDRQRVGEDSRLCDSGILVYSVDATKMNASQTILVHPAHTGDAGCGSISNAAFDLGPGEVAAFEDDNIKVELLQAFPDGSYRVRVTRK